MSSAKEHTRWNQSCTGKLQNSFVKCMHWPLSSDGWLESRKSGRFLVLIFSCGWGLSLDGLWRGFDVLGVWRHKPRQLSHSGDTGQSPVLLIHGDLFLSKNWDFLEWIRSMKVRLMPIMAENSKSLQFSIEQPDRRLFLTKWYYKRREWRIRGIQRVFRKLQILYVSSILWVIFIWYKLALIQKIARSMSPA